MKKLQLLSMIAAVLAVGSLIAGSVGTYSAATVTSATTGLATISNLAGDYQTVCPLTLSVVDTPASNVVCTLARVIASGAYTQTIATVTCATNARTGSAAVTLANAHIKGSDTLQLYSTIGGVATNVTVIVDYNVQRW